ncbi:MAG: DegQ family serine endoprotease [Planctomycetes bacterium]|nr:DegQ family serine endoprotease [Planctomycetota bacterium]
MSHAIWRSGYFGILSWLVLSAGLSLPVSGQAADPEDVALLKKMSRALAGIAREVRPAVVHVSSVRKMGVTQRSGRREHHFRWPPRSEELFDDFSIPEDLFKRWMPPQFRERWPEQRGTGTGVIVDPKGYILTNNHVIDQASEVTVKLSEKEELPARVVGVDPKTDLAVIQIDQTKLPVARLGDSDRVEVGEMVVAIGNPFGLDRTVTLGIVSAKGRTNLHLADYEDFIQTDAAVNPGNSGGPLLNLDGEVIAINTAIASASGSNAGVGFAIPINLARSVMQSLIRDGKVTRGFLGIKIQDLTPDLAKEMGLNRTEGVLVADLFEDSPAGKAGVQAGDVILKFDGHDVKNTNDLRHRVAATPVGGARDIVLWRNGEERTVTVKVGELTPEVAGGPGGRPTSSETPFGLTLQELTPELTEQFRLNPKAEGLLVTEVEPGSSAEEAAIEPGDLVLEAARKPVKKIEDFRDAAAKVGPNQSLLLRVQSEEGTRFVVLKRKAQAEAE